MIDAIDVAVGLTASCSVPGAETISVTRRTPPIDQGRS